MVNVVKFAVKTQDHCMEQNDVDILLKYFPTLTETQIVAFQRMPQLYREWNEKINVVSRVDIDHVFERHILHSLAIAAMLGSLVNGTEIMDLGTGGGFPGIPLAVMYPHCKFHLIDRIGKKIMVATDIARKLGLNNVTVQHGDSGECHRRFDYVVSRAVMALEPLVRLSTKHILHKSPRANRYAPGLVCLKGGDLSTEISAVSPTHTVVDIPITDFFDNRWFDTKEIIYVPL